VYGIGEITPTYFRAGVKIKPHYQLCIHICWLILFFQGNNWEKLISLITQEIKLKDHTSQKNKMSTFCDYIYFRGVKIKPQIESSTCLTWLLLYFSVGQSVKKSE
jgi:hypothetical protein